MNQELAALRAEIQSKSGKTPEQLYEEREKRVREAIELKKPDRVPLFIMADPGRHLGLPRSAAYYDPIPWKIGMRQLTLEYEPDLAMAGFASSGAVWEALDVKNRLWPGGNLPPDYEYQFVEGEYMKEDEYDIFLKDPTDFTLRHYLPRVYGALAPLAKLPPMDGLFIGFEMMTGLFATPEFAKMASAMARAGREMQSFREKTGDAQEELAQLGFPAFSHMGGGIGGAPFDTISSSLRGMKGSMLDMYRQPEKLLQACEAILERRIARATPADPKRRGNPKRIGMPLWRGDKAFMSDQQFQKFYWPGLKKAMQTLIDLGFVPMPFFEAEFGNRLECLREMPKGKVIAVLEHMDVPLAKKVLGDHTCILGKGPSSLRFSTLKEIEEYYKRQIEIGGKDGGFMLNIHLPQADKADLHKMLDNIRKFGTY